MPSLARTHMAAGRSFVVVHSTMRASLLGGSHFLTLGVDHFFLGLFFLPFAWLDLSLFCLSLFGHVIDPFDFILDNTVGNYSTANRQASFKTSPSIARVAAGAISFISEKNTL